MDPYLLQTKLLRAKFTTLENYVVEISVVESSNPAAVVQEPTKKVTKLERKKPNNSMSIDTTNSSSNSNNTDSKEVLKSAPQMNPQQDTSSKQIFRTEPCKSIEPIFKINQFLFKLVPFEVNQSTSPLFVFEILVQVFSISDKGVEKLYGKGSYKSLNAQNYILQSCIVQVLIQNASNTIPQNFVDLQIQIVPKEPVQTVIQKNLEVNQEAMKRIDVTGKSKLAELVSEIRQSGEVQLKLLQETAKMKDGELQNQIKILSLELEQKRLLLDKLLQDVSIHQNDLQEAKQVIEELRNQLDKSTMKHQKYKTLIAQLQQDLELKTDESKLFNKVKVLQQQLEDKRELEIQYSELKKAHLDQSVRLQNLQKKMIDGNKYKDICGKQEQVISKLEALLKNIASNPPPQQQQQQQQQNATTQTSRPASAKPSSPKVESEEPEPFKSMTRQQLIQYIQELQLNNDVLKSKYEEADERSKLMEDELMNTANNYAEELAQFRVKLANVEAGLPATGFE